MGAELNGIIFDDQLRDSTGVMPLRVIVAYRPPHYVSNDNALFSLL